LISGGSGDIVKKKKEAQPYIKNPPVPHELSELSYWDALHLFNRADCDQNGSLEAPEFKIMLEAKFPHDVWWVDLEKMFQMIDRDGTKTVDIEEFLAWIWSVPSQKQRNEMREMRPSSSTGMLSPSSPKSPWSPKSSREMSTGSPGSPKLSRPASSASLTGSRTPLSPKSPTSPNGRAQSRSALTRAGLQMTLQMPQRPLSLEIVYGPDFDSTLGQASKIHCLTSSMKQAMGDLIHIRKNKKNDVSGCVSCRVLMGTGIDLWNQGKMIMFRDNPFGSLAMIEAWAKEMAQVHFPLLLRIQNDM